MVFDVREPWRRSKQQRYVNTSLNFRDFYGHEYAITADRHQVGEGRRHGRTAASGKWLEVKSTYTLAKDSIAFRRL